MEKEYVAPTHPNASAFAIPAVLRPDYHEHSNQQDGLNIRQYFAANALQGILANGLFQNNSDSIHERTMAAARTAVQAADALIIQLNKEKKP